ncbi:unnamed protein product [Rotaria socialis]
MVKTAALYLLSVKIAQQPNNSVIVYPTDAPYVSLGTLFNAVFRIILNGNQTSGLLTMVEDLIYNGTGSRSQIHTKEDQTLHVLNGSLQIYMNGYQFCAPAGTTAYIPRNVTQSQRNLGSKPIDTQLLYSPSSMENYLYQVISLVAQQTINRTEVAELAATRGIFFVRRLNGKI